MSWMLSINWHDRLHEPLHIVKEELGLDVNVDFSFCRKMDKELENLIGGKNMVKELAFQQQILVARLVKNNGVPFKNTP